MHSVAWNWSVADWTLRWSEARKKSKKEVKAWRIGRWSGVRHGWSPKRKSKRGGLDVEAEWGTDEVQKGRSQRDGLDVEAEWGTDEVQNRNVCVQKWTLWCITAFIKSISYKATCRNRTGDLFITSETLYRLSQGGIITVIMRKLYYIIYIICFFVKPLFH